MRGDYDEGRAGDEVGFGTNKTGSAIRAAVRGGRDVRSQFSQCAGQDHVLETESRKSLSFMEVTQRNLVLESAWSGPPRADRRPITDGLDLSNSMHPCILSVTL